LRIALFSAVHDFALNNVEYCKKGLPFKLMAAALSYRKAVLRDWQVDFY
jgi:hypothetical protein